jgi:formamidopyrimidine-DNA glycosylase
MDQSAIAGIGNEYSDEILFQAGIDPHHRIGDLSKAMISKLYKKINSVLKYSTKIQIHAIRVANGKPFFTKSNRELFPPSYLQAHRHIDKKCPKNKNHLLKKTTIAGRSSYYCPKDQQ